MLALLLFLPRLVAADEAKLIELRSYHDLPPGTAVSRDFECRNTSDLVRQFGALGITLAPLPEKDGELEISFTGGSVIWEQNPHGTVDAPFSGSLLSLQNCKGIVFGGSLSTPDHQRSPPDRPGTPSPRRAT